MFCKKCGNELKDDFEFCNKCGTKVNDDNIVKDKVQNNTNKMDIEKYKKVTLISVIALIISFILVGITASMQMTPTVNFIWSLSKIVCFMSLAIYLISMIVVTVISIKNKEKLKGWISVLQTITIVILLTVAVIAFFGYISMKPYQI